MKYTLHGLDLWYLLQEWHVLHNARIDKIYQYDQTLILKLFVSGKGNVFFVYERPALAYITQKKPTTAEQLPHFAQFLRKHLMNARIRAIEQPSKRERMIKIVLEKVKDDILQRFFLFFELRNPGNVIFTDEHQTILMAFEHKKFSTRTIRPKAQYEVTIREDFTQEQFYAALSSSEKPLVKWLALDAALGGVYAEELCVRAQVEKNLSSRQLTHEQKERLWKHYLLLFEQTIQPQQDQNHVYPFPLQTIATIPAQAATYNEAIVQFLAHDQPQEQEDPLVKKKKAIIKQQEQQLVDLEKQAKEAQRKGELIYEHYHELLQLYELIHQYKLDGKSLKDIKPLLLKQFPFVKTINEKQQTIIVTFDDSFSSKKPS